MSDEPLISWKVETPSRNAEHNFLLPQSYRRAKFGGIAVSNSLICIVGLHQDTVAALKFFTSENGEGLATNPFGSEHIRSMTVFKTGVGAIFGGSFNLTRAIQEFRDECSAERIIYDADEIPFDFEGGVPIKRDDAALSQAAGWMYANRVITSRSGHDPRLAVLTHYLRDLPPSKGFEAQRSDLSVPLLATLHAIVAAKFQTQQERQGVELRQQQRADEREQEKKLADAATRKAEAERERIFKAKCAELLKEFAQLPADQTRICVDFSWGETSSYTKEQVEAAAVALLYRGGKLRQ